jgi:hypothetical protein
MGPPGCRGIGPAIGGRGTGGRTPYRRAEGPGEATLLDGAGNEGLLRSFFSALARFSAGSFFSPFSLFLTVLSNSCRGSTNLPTQSSVPG